MEFLVFLGFIAFWILILNIIGYCSGWQRLAKAYPHTGSFDGRLRRFRKVQLSSCNYGVNIGTNATGLYLTPFFLLRPGHPPIFIPWTEITMKLVKGWFWTHSLEMTFALAPGVLIRLHEKYGKELAADANRAWDSKAEATNSREAE